MTRAGVSNVRLEASIEIAGYGKRPVLRNINVSVAPGEILAVMGHNGAGKTTLIRAIYGLVDLFKGEVRLGSFAKTNPSPGVLLGVGVAYVPTAPNIFTELSIRENLTLSLRRADIAQREKSFSELEEIFPELMSRVDMAAGKLSGGQRQMVAVARAMMTGPRVLLLDEPSVGLAPVVAENLIDKIRAIADQGVAVVLIEQNVGLALGTCDAVCIVREGEVIRSGTPDEFSSYEDMWTLF